MKEDRLQANILSARKRGKNIVMPKNEAELKQINLLSRVDRSDIVRFFQDGFDKLPVYAPHQLSKESRIKYRTECWTIPESAYQGRKLTDSLRETMRAWIVRHLSHYIPEGETIMVALEDWQDPPRLVLYRREQTDLESSNA